MLSIRNLTSVPIDLVLLERYRVVPSRGRYLTGFISNTTEPTTRRLGPGLNSFVRQETSLRVESFRTLTTDISPFERSVLDEVLVLTFETDGQRYRISTPAPNNASQTLEPLDAEPKHELTGIFLAESVWLSIYSSHNLQAWMKYLHDATPLSALSIPGTHNSAACKHGLRQTIHPARMN